MKSNAKSFFGNMCNYVQSFYKDPELKISTEHNIFTPSALASAKTPLYLRPAVVENFESTENPENIKNSKKVKTKQVQFSNTTQEIPNIKKIKTTPENIETTETTQSRENSESSEIQQKKQARKKTTKHEKKPKKKNRHRAPSITEFSMLPLLPEEYSEEAKEELRKSLDQITESQSTETGQCCSTEKQEVKKEDERITLLSILSSEQLAPALAEPPISEIDLSASMCEPVLSVFPKSIEDPSFALPTKQNLQKTEKFEKVESEESFSEELHHMAMVINGSNIRKTPVLEKQGQMRYGYQVDENTNVKKNSQKP